MDASEMVTGSGSAVVEEEMTGEEMKMSSLSSDSRLKELFDTSWDVRWIIPDGVEASVDAPSDNAKVMR